MRLFRSLCGSTDQCGIVHRIVRHSEIIFEIPVVFPILNIKRFAKYINVEVFKLLVCD